MATTLENRSGYESHDRRHGLELHTVLVAPRAMRFGSSVTWESGRPYSTLAYRIEQDAIPPALAGLTRSVPLPRLGYATETRNSERNASFLNVDLRLSEELRAPSRLGVRWTLDVRNALNDRSYRIDPGERAYGRRIDGFDDATSRFGRRYELGLTLDF